MELISNEKSTCGCKGVRFCAACKDSDRVLRLQFRDSEEIGYANYKVFVYNLKMKNSYSCAHLKLNSSLEDIQEAATSTPSDVSTSLAIEGLLLIENFITEDEETRLMKTIDKVDWALSQSGRRKQDYGPKVNFKHKKVKLQGFAGMPEYADFLLNKMSVASSSLRDYLPLEMCNLEYEDIRQSTIEFHKDDMWIWGNRLISINLLSGSVMTMINPEKEFICFVWMPHLSLFSMADEARYEWKHGVQQHHIRGRRIALTMREADKKFQVGGELYETIGKDLLRICENRVYPSN
ncbi:unnamed protein product, partial [Mesorhabditis belari]|uniref:Alpha-ketoglutarate-dependent dioxygenase AlkB-like domain-containing protein n=1 Tax=Mesorhabditis belari TaxID=2138241 RepID=A0AAF3ETY3_9BILA